eukprot:CAMPEP_0179059738 /NCGR_PEP_ID=MMETSP0796-20121207/25509_1 /TAXON_ID=73915 /ORGANISM="Pyrodinium bahamense, Strain pbaha01" /LENGTH=284 /DNA_ID=CAMNT_0020756507 /DNA_START=38 /DNA_END=888 /DNA_ORIENTATION=+
MRSLKSPPGDDEQASVCTWQSACGNRQLRALRDFAEGDVLFTEEPLLLVPENPLPLLCAAPNAQTLLEAGAALGTYRSLAAYAAYVALSGEGRQAVDMFRADPSPLFTAVRCSVEQLLAERPVLAAIVDWPEVVRLHGVLNTNAVKLCDGTLALYRRACVASHSCAPNCEVLEARETAATAVQARCGSGDAVDASRAGSALLRARAPIQKGEEEGDDRLRSHDDSRGSNQGTPLLALHTAWLPLLLPPVLPASADPAPLPCLGGWGRRRSAENAPLAGSSQQEG